VSLGTGQDEVSFGRAAGHGEGTAPKPSSLNVDASGLAIATIGLAKRFRNQMAVDGIDLAVPRGTVYGFLGPNGSGKTTTIRMLLGLIQPTGGSQRLLGVSMPAGANAVLPRVGSLVEGPAFYPQLSGREALPRVLARHEAAPGHRGRPAAAAGADDPGRADERPRPTGHP
jgi:ABC-type transporter Mla maintaining outer membrane lipid asymmetry ATPase subunit MlaF